MSALREAARRTEEAASGFLGRVRALGQGDQVSLPDGTVVKRVALEDGRDAFKVGRPTTWRSDQTVEWSDTYRTAEKAVSGAFMTSAGSEDPASLGGETRYSRWSPLLHGGREVRLDGVDTAGRPRVRNHPPRDGRDGEPRTASWGALTKPKDRVMMSLREEAPPGAGGWKTVGPEARKKLEPLIRYYMKKPHPFTACKRDQMKHGLSEQHANGRCAVLKDLGEGGNTRWRKGGKKVAELEAEAKGRVEAVREAVGDDGLLALVAHRPNGGGPTDDLAEMVQNDLMLLEWMGVELELEEVGKTYTQAERKKAKTQPGAGDRFPIDNVEDLKRAIKAFGRSKTPDATKRWIKSRARALKATNLLPAAWSAGSVSEAEDSPELKKLMQKFTGQGMPEAAARKAAQRALRNRGGPAREAERPTRPRTGRSRRGGSARRSAKPVV